MTEETNPVRNIRKNVFKMSQQEFADAIGVTQGMIHKYEKAHSFSAGAQRAVIAAAKLRDIHFDPAWFFEIPQSDDQAVAS